MEQHEGSENQAASVLVFDAGKTVGASFEDEAAAVGLRAQTVTTRQDAADVLLANDVDCLVVTPDSLDDTDAFLDVLENVAPGCPLVAVTRPESEPLADDLVDRASSIVEQTDDSAEWGFLVEKIRSSLREDVPVEEDPELYRLLVENARDGLYRLDANGDVVYANESFADMLGYDREEIVGVHGSDAMAEGELERGQQVIQELIEADDRKSEAIDIEMTAKDGERVVLAVNFVVLQTADGVYDGVMGIARDVTDRRERERTLERQNERLEKFASVVSHDLRNPLNVAAGRLELGRENVDDENLEVVADAHDQMRALIDDLLALARDGEAATDIRSVDLAATAEDCWQNVATSNASLETETSMRIEADQARLSRLLENLFRNAIDHAGDAPSVVVGSLDDRDGFYVADDGPGVSADSAAVFEAGYSTDPDGTGFGLSIVEDVVDAHDWDVGLTESRNGGARFEISGVDVVEE